MGKAVGLNPEQILVDFFEHHLDDVPEDASVTARVDAVARKHGVSRQAVLHHLESDKRWQPTVRDDVDTTASGVWRMKSPDEIPLAREITAAAERRREAAAGLAKAQEIVDKATAELVPLLARARKAAPGTRDHLTLGQLRSLTGISRGHISKLATDYLEAQAAKRRQRRPASSE